MPYALACITGKTIDECVKLLKEHLGDVAITGVFFPVGRRILLNLGFSCRDIDPRDFPRKVFSSYKTFLVEILGPVVVVNRQVIYDNGSWRNNTHVGNLRHMLRVIEVEKEKENENKKKINA